MVNAEALGAGFGAEGVGVGGEGGDDDAFGGVEGGREGGDYAGGEEEDFA